MYPPTLILKDWKKYLKIIGYTIMFFFFANLIYMTYIVYLAKTKQDNQYAQTRILHFIKLKPHFRLTLPPD